MDIEERVRVSGEEYEAALRDTVQMVCEILGDGEEDGYIPVLITHELILDKNEQMHNTVNIHMLVDLEMDERYERLRQIGEIIGGEKRIVRMAFFCSEAWVSTEDDPERRKYSRPSEDPQRQECVLAAGLTVDGRAAIGMVYISRDARERMKVGEVVVRPHGQENTEMKNPLLAEFFQGLHMGLMKVVMPGAADYGSN